MPRTSAPVVAATTAHLGRLSRTDVSSFSLVTAPLRIDAVGQPAAGVEPDARTGASSVSASLLRRTAACEMRWLIWSWLTLSVIGAALAGVVT